MLFIWVEGHWLKWRAIQKFAVALVQHQLQFGFGLHVISCASKNVDAKRIQLAWTKRKRKMMASIRFAIFLSTARYTLRISTPSFCCITHSFMIKFLLITLFFQIECFRWSMQLRESNREQDTRKIVHQGNQSVNISLRKAIGHISFCSISRKYRHKFSRAISCNSILASSH